MKSYDCILRSLLCASFALILIGCTGTITPHPAPTVGIPPDDALIADDFARPNTPPGTLYSVPTGQAYTLYVPSTGTELNVISSVGQIWNDAFVAPLGQTVYAAVVADQPIIRIGMRFHFAPGYGSDANSVAMAISKNDLYIADMAVHFYVDVNDWNLQKRSADGPFISVCSGKFSDALRTDGTEYAAEVELTNNAARVSVAGNVETCNSPNAKVAIGPYVFWENYYGGNSPVVTSAISAVWATATEGSTVVRRDDGKKQHLAAASFPKNSPDS